MKILIVGSGGREHALAESYSNSKKVAVIFVAPGNDFIPRTVKNAKMLPDIKPHDLEKIVSFAKKEKVDLVDVAMDDPIAQGLVDLLQKANIPTFGPTKKAAQIEWDKSWAREFMKKYNLPIPLYKSFTSEADAITFINKEPEQLFYVKAAGLAAGKGAIRAENHNEAITAIKTMKQFASAGKTFLIEKGMVGKEFSLFAICDGKNYCIINVAQDHKTVFDNDLGPNTGGMGCVSPISLTSPISLKKIEQKILQPFMQGMVDEGRPYAGILYLGGMVTNPQSASRRSGGIQIVEFNARWGDPEAQVILPGIQTDYLDIVSAVTMQQLSNATINVDKKVRISIAGCAKGYPEDYESVKGKIVSGLDNAIKMPGIKIFGAGIKKVGKNFVVNGGRVFHLVAEGDTIQQARRRAYNAIKHITIEDNNLHYRTDIGWRELKRAV